MNTAPRVVGPALLFAVVVLGAVPAQPAQVLQLECPETLADLTLKSEERPIHGPENFNLTCHYNPPDSEYGQGSHYLVFVWIVAHNPRLPQNYGCERSTSSYVESPTHKAEVLVVGERFSSSGYPTSVAAAKAAIDSRLAEMEKVALRCDAATPSPSTAASCAPEGRVTDHRGRAVEGIEVAVRTASGEESTTVTDASGMYRFASTPGADPSSQITIVTRTVNPGRFSVTHDGRPGELTSDPFTPTQAEPCSRDFPAGSLPDRYVSSDPGRDRWADIIDVYQNIRLALRLAERLGISFGSSIDVHAWCDKAASVCPARRGEAGSEFGVVNVDATGKPFIGIGEGASKIGAVNKPDNIEYHEFGHIMMTLAYGAFPDVRRTHGGYGEFDSAGSFVEGFADFYAMMVAKHEEKRAFPELYRQGGGYWNLETNYPPWGLGGTTEEYAVAGALLDLEDGTADYATPRPEKQYTVECCVTVAGGALVAGSVVYTRPADASLPAAASEATVAVVTFSDGSKATVPVDPPNLAPGQKGVFVAPLPPGASVTVGRVLEGRPGSVLVDDDAVDVTLEQLWQTILGHGSRDRRANRHVITIADLYDAVRPAFGGDADADGIDDVDAIFIAHGLFADTNGNQSHDAGETIGLTSHPSGPGYTERRARRNAPPLPETMAKADTRGVASRVQVQVSFDPPNDARSYGYTSARAPDGSVMIAVPPRGSGATARLIALADGYEPALLGTIDAEQYWTDAERHPGESFLAFDAAMVPMESAGPGGFPTLLVFGIVAAVLGLVIVALRMRARAVRPAAIAVCGSCGSPSTGSPFCVTCGARLAG